MDAPVASMTFSSFPWLAHPTHSELAKKQPLTA
jgi:hypothetical protein